jgi:hypothetical protein
MSSPVSSRWRAIPFAEFTPRLHGSFPRPLIRSPPANRLQPTQLLVRQPRLPGSLPSLNRLVATWLPSPFFPGPATRPEGLLAGWIIPLPKPLSPRELGWPSDPCDNHSWLPRCSAPFLEFRLAVNKNHFVSIPNPQKAYHPVHQSAGPTHFCPKTLPQRRTELHLAGGFFPHSSPRLLWSPIRGIFRSRNPTDRLSFTPQVP